MQATEIDKIDKRLRIAETWGLDLPRMIESLTVLRLAGLTPQCKIKDIPRVEGLTKKRIAQELRYAQREKFRWIEYVWRSRKLRPNWSDRWYLGYRDPNWEESGRSAKEIAEHRSAQRKGEIHNALHLWAHGDTEVEWVDSVEECNAERKVTGAYTRSGGVESNWLSVRAMLHTAKLPMGQRVINGIVTLGAELSRRVGDMECYKCCYAYGRKVKGLEVVNGYIATCGDVAYHDDTDGGAISGLLRKLTPRKEVSDEEKKKQRIKHLTAIAKDRRPVTAAVFARETGACRDGIRAWVERHNNGVRKLKFSALRKLMHTDEHIKDFVGKVEKST